ncbi:futalosine hydrolase [Phycisphaerales bacterium ac7]
MSHSADAATRLLDPLRGDRRLLLVVAASTEACRVVEGVTGSRPETLRVLWQPQELDDRVSLLLTGVGKANAAGAVGHALSRESFGAVVSLGIGGSLPTDESGSSFHHEIGDIIRCEQSVFADEGVISDDGWQSMADRGFGPRTNLSEPASMGVGSDSRALELLAGRFPDLGSAATVSTCSGTAEAAWNTAARSGCTVEAMEGAAVGLAVLRSSPETPFVELRVISNRTGTDQRWDLPYALDRLTDLASAL